jgi:hypothetical protein
MLRFHLSFQSGSASTVAKAGNDSYRNGAGSKVDQKASKDEPGRKSARTSSMVSFFGYRGGLGVPALPPL